jgi:hypothetical protein
MIDPYDGMTKTMELIAELVSSDCDDPSLAITIGLLAFC